ncbi:MAG TPA: amino acid--tRNA ligase-related protein [Candidatus Bathyarchaeia archaeon]|nr:amino acid--tRNA ligase-related protein [Candidatus Bathyarchaeia archaeon]
MQKPIYARKKVYQSSFPSEKIFEKLAKTANRFELYATPEMQAVARIEASLLRGARKYFDAHDFTEIIAPHLTRATGACENIATMFTVDHFGENCYLAQTGQLYLEVLTPFLKKVWCIGPSFRAEPAVDERHLTEFTLVELEFEGDLWQLMHHIEGTIYSMIQECIATRSEDLKLLGVDKDRVNVKPPFKKVSYADAVEQLSSFGVKWGDDLKSIHEKALVEVFGSKPLFVTHYPKAIKFFNMKQNSYNSNVVNSTDLLLPCGGEAVGAAERECEYEPLLQRLKDSNMLRQLIEKGGSIHDFDWYLEFYRLHGGTQHSGCGIGLNRVTQYVLGSSDIRASTVFPMNKQTLM